MNEWVLQNIVCPRDHGSLELTHGKLVCPANHTYPVVDGIPIMLLEEAVPTQQITVDTFHTVAAIEKVQENTCSSTLLPYGIGVEGDGIHAHVQGVIGAT